jgi:hypothetical protein
MTKTSSFRKTAAIIGTLLGFMLIELNPEVPFVGVSFTSEAEARLGRPLTPVSVAGVARRTTRRVVRRSAIFVSTLPAGCGQVNINGAMYWQCGATYYQQSGAQYVVVYVD